MNNDFLKTDKAIDWELFITRNQKPSPAFSYLILECHSPEKWIRQTTGLSFDFKYTKRVRTEYYWSVSRTKKLHLLLKEFARKNPRHLLFLLKKAESHCIELIRFAQSTKKQDFSKLSNDVLADLYKNYWEKQKKAASFMWIKHKLNLVLEEEIKMQLAQLSITKSNPSEYFNLLLKPAKNTVMTQAYKELQVMAQGNVTDQNIATWLEKYNWIETYTWVGKLLNKKSVLVKISKLKKQNTPKTIENKDSIKLMKDLKKYPSLLWLVKSLQFLLYFHTFEFETISNAHYWSKNLLQEISSRVGLKFEEYPYAVYPEIYNALKSLDKKKILERRENQIAIYAFNGNLHIAEGTQLSNVNVETTTVKFNNKFLHGRIAFKGLRKGRAIIIKRIEDLKKLRVGDVIVASMTTVEFTPSLSKAVAIVTDEGGITCHAALIAREFKIPCIIGTKFATQVLQDGDLIEVNANRGTIKIC